MMKTNKARVLVIDGDPSICELIHLALSKAALETITAASAGEALALIRLESFDFILLEYQLPDGSGLELCRAIRAFDAKTPIYFCTAGWGATFEQAREAGALGVLIKPLDISHLHELIEIAMRGNR